MENKPQIGIVAPEADITILFSELGKKSPIVFSLADILPVPFETESYPFVLGGADGIIIAARIEQAKDIEKIVEIVKTCKLVRRTDRFHTLLAIVLWGAAADEAALGIAHPNVLVCNSNSKHLPPTEALAKILQTEVPSIETLDWIDRYEFIANRFALKKVNQPDGDTSEKLKSLEADKQHLENQLARLKEGFAKQNDERINALDDAKQNAENQFLQIKTEFAAEKDEKLNVLKANRDLENQLIRLKEDFAVQSDEKPEENASLVKELANLKKDLAAQNDERVKSLQKAVKILEKEITQLNENLAEKNGEFEQFITLKNSELEDLRNNQEDKKKIKALQKTNQSLEKNLIQIKEELEILTNEKIISLEEANQSLEKEAVQLREEFAVRTDEKVKALESRQDLENQLVQLKTDLTKESTEKLDYLQASNENLENQLARLKQDLESQANQQTNDLEKAKQSLEQELAQANEEFAAKSEEFEKVFLLKNSEIEELQKNGLEEKIIRVLQEDNQNLENQLTRLKQDSESQANQKINALEEAKQHLEQELAQSNEEFAAKSEEFERIILLKNSKIEELQENSLEEKIIISLQESNESLEQELAVSKKEFFSKSKELETLISLKDIIIEDLQTNQAKDNQILEEQLARLEEDFAAQNDKKITLLENDNKILDYQLTQLKKDFATQTDEFEKLSSLKNAMIEDLRIRHGEENKKLAVLAAGLNDEIYELKTKNIPDIARLENELSAKTEQLGKVVILQAEQNKKLEESAGKIKELQAEKTDISNRENLLQKDLSDLIIHLREEFVNSRHELTGKDTEIQRLREQLERQNELTEVVLKSTKGGDVAALRLEIDNEFSDDKPLYQIYSQLSLLRKECEFLLEEKESLQRSLDVTKENSFSLREEPKIAETGKFFAEELLEI